MLPFALAGTAEKRQAAFFRVVYAVLLDDLRVEHYGICRCPSAFIKKRDDAFFRADHIRRHTDATFLVRHQRIKQVLRDLQIVFRRDLRLSRKENRVVHEFFNHGKPQQSF